MGISYFFKKSLLFIRYMLLDVALIFSAYIATSYLLNFLGSDIDMRSTVRFLPILAVYKVTVFLMFGLYHTLIKHFGFEDLLKLIIVVILSNVFAATVIWVLGIPFAKTSFILITPIEIAFLATPRLYFRIIEYFKTYFTWGRALSKKTLIIGAGAAGEMVVKEIFRNKELNNIPVVFVDDDPRKIGNRLMGINVVGPISKTIEFIVQYDIEEVILAIAHLPLKVEQDLLRQINELSIKVKKLISLSEMNDKKPIIRAVNLEDLLNRMPITLDNEGIADFIKGEVVLVTGGGGSIGSELCRQIAKLAPKELIIFDIYENNAYDIQMELLRKFKKAHKEHELQLTVLIGSVYNHKRLEEVYKKHRPTIVFHAAAYKHVPLMEDSPVEAVRTNVLGTHNAALLANQYAVKKFVLVSSDKAVRSTNIMGATKRYAELICQSMNKENKTKFAAVRFGNVLGSSGSVIPLFEKQIADGGPITVTHKDITRYFMTIEESVSLILQCAVYAHGGEIFVLDMGEPVKIKDLAEKMIRLAGYKPYIDIDIEYTGLRPGEKLYEELLVDHNHEVHKNTENSKIFVETEDDTNDDDLALSKILEIFEDIENNEIKQMVSQVIKSYKVNGNGA